MNEESCHLKIVKSTAWWRRRSRIWRGGWPCWTATPGQSPAWREDRTRCSGCGRSGSWRWPGPCSPRGCRGPRTAEIWGWPQGTRRGGDMSSALATKYWDQSARVSGTPTFKWWYEWFQKLGNSVERQKKKALGHLTFNIRSFHCLLSQGSPGRSVPGWLWEDISRSACNKEKSRRLM